MQRLSLEQSWNLQLGGGDDYELCFSIKPELEQELPAMAARAGVQLTVIGRFTRETSIRFLKSDGANFLPQSSGFDHFPEGRKEVTDS